MHHPSTQAPLGTIAGTGGKSMEQSNTQRQRGAMKRDGYLPERFLALRHFYCVEAKHVDAVRTGQWLDVTARRRQ